MQFLPAGLILSICALVTLQGLCDVILAIVALLTPIFCSVESHTSNCQQTPVLCTIFMVVNSIIDV